VQRQLFQMFSEHQRHGCAQVVAVSDRRLVRPAPAAGAPDLSWTLRWASDTSIAIGHGSQALLVSVR